MRELDATRASRCFVAVRCFRRFAVRELLSRRARRTTEAKEDPSRSRSVGRSRSFADTTSAPARRHALARHERARAGGAAGASAADAPPAGPTAPRFHGAIARGVVSRRG